MILDHILFLFTPISNDPQTYTFHSTKPQVENYSFSISDDVMQNLDKKPEAKAQKQPQQQQKPEPATEQRPERIPDKEHLRKITEGYNTEKLLRETEELMKKEVSDNFAPKIDSEVLIVEQKLIQCLNENKKTPLNCQEHVLKFQQAARRVYQLN
ncbi:hypothetical protein MP638_004806 [Amoeboaphelidium occidentale]|nr:hypothetical protein MP638_004806 [Amoeboaphelidium occidentale]